MTEAEYLKANLPLLVLEVLVHEDGAVEWCEEPEGDVCPDAE